MTYGAIIAARMNSSRLPGKVMMPLLGLPVIGLIVRRLSTSHKLSRLIVATTDKPEDDVVAGAAKAGFADVFRGNEDDVLGRYMEAAELHEFTHLVRVTGDCPFVDGPTLDAVLDQCEQMKTFDLATTKPAYPHGIDYEICQTDLLRIIHREKKPTADEREHLFNYIYHRPGEYRIERLTPPSELNVQPGGFLLDRQEDYDAMLKMTDGMKDPCVSVDDLIEARLNVH